MDWCAKRGVDYWNYVEACEGPEIWTYLAEVWEVMKSAVERGLEHEGVLPGELHLQRKAPRYYIKAKGYGANLQSRGLVFSYALAVSEENAGGGQIVTAPTCGSCGVVPAVLYHIYKSRQLVRPVSSMLWPLPDSLATLPRLLLRSPVRKPAAKRKWVWPVPWPPPRRTTASAEVWPVWSMLRKWDWSTILA